MGFEHRVHGVQGGEVAVAQGVCPDGRRILWVEGRKSEKEEVAIEAGKGCKEVGRRGIAEGKAKGKGEREEGEGGGNG